MDLLPRSRRPVATVLALVLAAGMVSAVAVAGGTGRTTTHPLPEQPPAGLVLAAGTTPEASRPTSDATMPASWTRPDDEAAPPRNSAVLVARAAAAAIAADEGETAGASGDGSRSRDRAAASGTKEARKAKAAAKTASKEEPARRTASPSYAGTNHVWIPSLGISRSVRWFPCDRQRPPDNYMYRWGCAGANNVYLMGHAYNVMKPLHDAYVSGTLRKGTKAWYADANGRVRVYAIRWWKVTLPVPEAEWAWAPQDVPSMTLQTCVGKDSRYRLMVRLVEVNR